MRTMRKRISWLKASALLCKSIMQQCSLAPQPTTMALCWRQGLLAQPCLMEIDCVIHDRTQPGCLL